MKKNRLLFMLIAIMIPFSYMPTSGNDNDITNKTEAASGNKVKLAETVYNLGYKLFTEKRYAEADMVLRYWLCAMYSMVPKEIEWTEKAMAILTSNEFYDYYMTTKSTNLLWLSTTIPDELLLDKESVKRKYLSSGNSNVDENSSEWSFKFNKTATNQVEITVRFMLRRIITFLKKDGNTFECYSKSICL